MSWSILWVLHLYALSSSSDYLAISGWCPGGGAIWEFSLEYWEVQSCQVITTWWWSGSSHGWLLDRTGKLKRVIKPQLQASFSIHTKGVWEHEIILGDWWSPEAAEEYWVAKRIAVLVVNEAKTQIWEKFSMAIEKDFWLAQGCSCKSFCKL